MSKEKYYLTFGDSQYCTDWLGESKNKRKKGVGVKAVSFADFEALLSPRVGDKDGPAFVAGRMDQPQRHAHAVAEMSLLVLDLDKHVDLEWLRARVEALGYRSILYTTHSHGKTTTEVPAADWAKLCVADDPEAEVTGPLYMAHCGYPAEIYSAAKIVRSDDGKVVIRHPPISKARLILFLAEPYDARKPNAGAVWGFLARNVAHHIGIQHDTACTDFSRLYYLPRVPAERKDLFRSWMTDGEAIRLEDFPEAPLDAPTRPILKRKTSIGDSAVNAEGGRIIVTLSTDGGDIRLDLSRWAAKHGKYYRLSDALESVDMLRGNNGEKFFVYCPFHADHSHSDRENKTETFCVDGDGERSVKIYCSHSGCQERADGDSLQYLAAYISSGVIGIEELSSEKFYNKEEK